MLFRYHFRVDGFQFECFLVQIFSSRMVVNLRESEFERYRIERFLIAGLPNCMLPDLNLDELNALVFER